MKCDDCTCTYENCSCKLPNSYCTYENLYSLNKEERNNMKLTVDAVNKIFLDCLFKEDEPHDHYVPVMGITMHVGFHPERLQSHKEEIKELLFELPEGFYNVEDGGHSFLEACYDKHENHWGEHRNMEQLFMLGLGVGLVKEVFPTDMRPLLPGGVPYYMVLQS